MVALGVVGAIVNAVSPGQKTFTAAGAGAPTDLPDLSRRTVSGPPPDTQPAEATQETQETTEPAPATTTPPPAKPVSYKGRGDSVVKIRKPGDGTGPVLVSITASGSSNFVVQAKGGEDQLLVNVIGSYTGTVLLDPDDESETTRLLVTASGRWTMTVAPLSAARVVTSRYTGHGDEVLIYDGPEGPSSATFTGPRAEDNFVVNAYNDDGQDLLVNEIEPYKGTVEVSTRPTLLVVNATGTWSVVFTA
ncbi:MAG TPA: hypothetical protein VMU51_00960 [Mycobacteriales bacterium]|nr:hypothetical protein [Mycobacteriales bacterium]